MGTGVFFWGFVQGICLALSKDRGMQSAFLAAFIVYVNEDWDGVSSRNLFA
jgi:hypothetical protein